jgi:biopolymer transport protein ExbD
MSLHNYGLRKDREAEEAARKRRSLVILTPLVDIVFILLIFFMLASSFADHRVIGLLTPAGTRQAAESDFPSAVLIRVGKDGSLDLSGQPMSDIRIAQEVARRSRLDNSLSFLVQPNLGVSLQQVITVVDLLKSAGARNISLTSRPRS